MSMTKSSSYDKSKYITDNKYSLVLSLISLIVIVEVFLFFCISSDPGSMAALRWLLVVGVIAVLMRPYLTVRSIPLWDNGFCVSFCLGLGLSFLLTWFISACGICPFGTALCFVVLILLGLCGYIVPRFSRIAEYKWDIDKIQRFLWGFAVFAIIFQFAFWVIGFNGVLDSGTENYMDYAFMQSMYRQRLAIPYDVWYAGEKLNYYYLGQAAAVYLCRLAFTIPEYGYNLTMCTFWAVSFVASGEIVYAVIMGLCAKEDNKCAVIAASIGAFAGSVYNAFAANGHWLLFGVLGKIINVGSNSPDNTYQYWFPEATVYISTELGDVDNGKNEFPAYSAVLGDLHAHVINLIFVVALVALILDYVFVKKKDEKRKYANLVLCGILLGLFKGSNYWDFAIYYVIVGGVVVFGDLAKKGFNLKTFVGIAIKAATVTILSMVTILPFTLNFKKMASEICIADTHSPVSKLIVLWGMVFAISIGFLVWTFVTKNEQIAKRPERFGLLAFALCTMGLVIVPEVIYIKDIYGDTNTRFNTMFKLTYQAFVLFGIIIAIAAGVYLYDWLSRRRKSEFAVLSAIAAGIIIVFILCSASYTKHALNDWMGDVTVKEDRAGISMIEPMYDQPNYYYEMQIYDVLKNDDREQLNIIEGSGDSYCPDNTLSVMLGACTPLGWYVHEWMWRDDSDIVGNRFAELMSFYENGDRDFVRSIVQKYDADYIIIGPSECRRYAISYYGLEEIGEVIWEEYDDELGLMQVIKIK